MKLQRFAFHAMGCPCALQLYGTDSADLEKKANVAIDDVLRLEAKYSRYRDDSHLSQINRSAGCERGVTVDSETASLLDYADAAHAGSGGLFDVTSGALRRAWDFKSGRLPDPELLAEVLAFVGWQRVHWDSADGNVQRRIILEPGMEIDLGGIVKEYAVDRVAAILRAQGVENGLVDLGGDIAVVGPHPSGSPWAIGVRDPRIPRQAISSLELADGAIASSGDYERFMVVDGKRYGHILDPHTGWPVPGLASVSVVAEHCVVAGAASTTALLLGREAGPRYLRELGLPHVYVGAEGELGGTIGPEAAPRGDRNARAKAHAAHP